VNSEIQRARALCVGRHPFLSDHIARYFASLGVETRHAVGLEHALAESRCFSPDVVIAEYELLAMLSLEAWERDELLSRTAVIAVSLTRRPQEAHLLDISGIAGFLYLPQLDAETATRLVGAAAASSRARYTPSLPRPAEAVVPA
jgi:chemotaxis response regulator CheB